MLVFPKCAGNIMKGIFMNRMVIKIIVAILQVAAILIALLL